MRDTWTVTQIVSLQNSFSSWNKSIRTMKYNLSFNEDKQYGSFEIYDLESGGNDFYSEGGLWFDKNELQDYDGIFSLPVPILDKLEEWGLNVSDMREALK